MARTGVWHVFWKGPRARIALVTRLPTPLAQPVDFVAGGRRSRRGLPRGPFPFAAPVFSRASAPPERRMLRASSAMKRTASFAPAHRPRRLLAQAGARFEPHPVGELRRPPAPATAPHPPARAPGFADGERHERGPRKSCGPRRRPGSVCPRTAACARAWYRIPPSGTERSGGGPWSFTSASTRGGDAEANIQRWDRAIPPTRSRPTSSAGERTTNGMKTANRRGAGHPFRPAPMAQAPSPPKANYGLVAARRRNAPRGSYFFKMTGPKERRRQARAPASYALLDSVHPKLAARSRISEALERRQPPRRQRAPSQEVG